MRRNRKSEPEEQSEGAPEWLTTYSDLVTLLLTFFVMLFSMAVIDKQKFIEVANSMRSSFLHTGSGNVIGFNGQGNAISTIDSLIASDKGSDPETDEENSEETSDSKGQSNSGGQGSSGDEIQRFKSDIYKEIQKANLTGFIKVIEEDEIITLRLNSIVLFDSGYADIKEAGKPILKKTGQLLKALDREIEIQGHTDNLPINTLLFPTNWELSTKRATNIVLYLINECGVAPKRLTASGNAEFMPVAPNDTEANRQKNRRIDIVVLK